MPRWEEFGCPICRRLWETGEQPPLVATSIDQHVHLHRCAACGTWWEQNERSAVPISEAEAQRLIAKERGLES